VGLAVDAGIGDNAVGVAAHTIQPRVTMIAFIEGTLLSGGTEAVVAVGGFGLEVHVSALCAGDLPPCGQQVRLWTHAVIREDGWFLYGFLDPEERSMFRLLISVSGVGPKVAMGMLSRARAGDLARYLRTGDEKALGALPGIGKKSAARLVVELGQRVPQGGAVAGAGATASSLRPSGPMGEAMAVLGAMGLPAVAAEQALRRSREGNPDLEADLQAWIRAALKHI